VVENVPEHLRQPVLVVPPAPDRHPYGDVTRLQVGQWARYREGARTLTLAAVGRDGEDVRIEVVEEGDPRQVSARRVRPDGSVRAAFYGEIHRDGARSAVLPQALEQSSRPEPPASGEATAEERVTVGGRPLAAKVVRVRSEDVEGRVTEEVTLWHPEVPPLYAGGVHGGLVARRGRRGEVVLLDFGADARPLLPEAGPK
jgi:hypothetical protein